MDILYCDGSDIVVRFDREEIKKVIANANKCGKTVPAYIRWVIETGFKIDELSNTK